MNKSDTPIPDDAQFVTATDISHPRGNPFPIVGIGASAGGLEAFGQLLEHLPPETGMAFVLVQHLDPQHASILDQLLAPSTRMPVIIVQDRVQVQPNTVYVMPPNTSIELENAHLRLVPRPPGLHLPIDAFFRSLAHVQGSRAIGVVLSGNASDGSLGLRAIKAECGITFAQDELTARFGGMPRNAIATGAVDFVLTPSDIGTELGKLGDHPYLVPQDPADPTSETLPDGDADLKRILAQLHSATKVDFSHYKVNTIRRRIGRRMMVLRFEDLGDYSSYIERHPSELRELYRDLLISVTNFFRDPGSFEAVARLVANMIRGEAVRKAPLRIWVPGCSTGEEVYSFAMSLSEVLHDTQSQLALQIFGTDISEVALDRARHGIYSETIAQDVSEDRLRRFFNKVEGGYQIGKAVRESCIFARHDVTQDPPFSQMDLVSCRNVLIYLDGALQRRVLPIFHYALKPTGLLVLGSAESTAAAADLFATIDKQYHIYAPKAVPVRLSFNLQFKPSSTTTAKGISTTNFRASDVRSKVDRVIQNKYSPDAVVIDAEMQILQFRGHTNAFLDPMPGEASLHILRMAKQSLVPPLRRAIQAAVERELSVREVGSLSGSEGGTESIQIEVTPIAGATPREHHYLIVFSRTNGTAVTNIKDRLSTPESDADDHIRALEQESADTREYVRNLREEYEAYAEELRAANEEVRSANEELQSTNEELGTTKEELQSTNEELTTVNEELQHRNQELNSTNSDLKNLLSAVSLGIVMVDQDIRVRRFNAAAQKLLTLGQGDVGRPLAHIQADLEIYRFEQRVRSVIDLLHATQDELQDIHGHWFLIGVRPYRTIDDRITGAVITIQDIDPLKRGLQAAEEARDYAEGMIETVREPLVVLDADLRVLRATSAFYETFLVSREETEGRFLYDLGSGQWNRPKLRELLGLALFRNQPFHDYEIVHDFPHIGRRTMRLNARLIPRADQSHRMLLLAMEDVSERQHIAEIRFQRLFETAKDAIVVIDAETGAILDINPFLLELTGFERQDFVGKPFAEAGSFRAMPDADQFLTEINQRVIARRDNLSLVVREAPSVSVDILGNRYHVGSQPVIQLNIRDITARRRAEQELRESEERFRLFVDSVKDYALFQLDTPGRILTWNSGAERLLGWQEHEVIGKSASIVFVPEDVAAGEAERELEQARLEGRAEDERWHMRKDGTRFFASGVLTQVCDEYGRLRGFAKIMRDVTVAKQQEERLRRTVEEKSMLVSEIHHRVKNNLQVIASLLSLQAGYFDDSHVLATFEETEGRVRAIARIHERLYANDNLTTIEFGAYLSMLARELLALHFSVPDDITLVLDVSKLDLHIEQAVPLGLIANELIINSIKHGLKHGGGQLEVNLSLANADSRNKGWATVRIADSGPGLPEDVDVEQAESMGLRLVNLLVKQVQGRLEVGTGPGANTAVVFPVKRA